MVTKVNMNENDVVLVDKNDNPIGLMPKLEAHQKGVLHRAFSVFLFNSAGQLLMQQRAAEKYHSANLWSNTCCSHPLPGEDIEAAALRRLNEEMGISCKIKHAFSFTYHIKLDNGLTENEYDHVFFGNFEGTPSINLDEVKNWKYISMEELASDLIANPKKYTEWLKLCMDNNSLELKQQ